MCRSARGTYGIAMRCPVCNREFAKESSAALPFCSERCRTIDLGRWLGESYRVPVIPDPEADEVPEELDQSSLRTPDDDQ